MHSTKEVTLYDDIRGTRKVMMIIKICSGCKTQHYPGHCTLKKSRRLYEDNWDELYNIFLSTNQTAFTLDFMKHHSTLVQRCQVAFLVRGIEMYLQCYF